MHRRTAGPATDQPGFTLIELVFVILILGILSAVALPRLLNQGMEARRAKIESILGSVRAAAQITRAAALVRNLTGPADRVTLDGTTVSTAYGYPDASHAGIVTAAGIDVGVDRVTLDARAAPGTLWVVVDGAPDPSTCRIEYTQANPVSGVPTITAPSTGC